jgi:hypothetical protein
MEKESVNGNNKNKTSLHKERSFTSGKNKHKLILIPIILLLTGILTLSLAAGQATAQPAINGNILYAKAISTLGSSSSGLSLNGNLTMIGSTSLNGNLTLSTAESVILGSPLIQSGTLNITADKIEIGKPSNENGIITMNGDSSNPTTVDIYGNILIGDPTTANGVFMNTTEYYQYIESNGPGYIGSIDNNNTLWVNSSTAIRVFQGTLYINFSSGASMLALINSTHAWIFPPWGPIYDLSSYGGVAIANDVKC